MKSCFYFSLFLLTERRLGKGRGKGQKENKDGWRRRLLAGDLCWKVQMVPEGAACPKGSLLCFPWLFPLF